MRTDSSQDLDTSGASQKKRHMRFASNKLERIKEAIAVNELLESKPTEIHNFTTAEKLMNLRPLEKDKILD